MAEEQNPHTEGHAHVHGRVEMGGSGPPDPLAVAHAEHEGGHANWKLYVLIGVALTIITAIEVAIFYIPQLEAVLVPTLLVLSAGKFITVVMFYMHLKFDSRIFTRVFVAPLFLAVLIVLALIVLFKVLPGYEPWR
jgi:cytochrome c oxidase subunit 4